MLDQAQKLGANMLDLIEAKARLFARDLEQTGKMAAALAIALGIAILGFLALASGVMVWASQILGAASALSLLGGVLLLSAALIVVAVRWRVGITPRPTRAELQRAADEARERLAHPSAGEGGSTSNLTDVASTVIKNVAANPGAAAGGVFALVSLLGPKRVLRVVGGLSAVIGFLISLLRAVRAAQSGLDAVMSESAGGNGAAASSNGVNRSRKHSPESSRVQEPLS